MLGEGWLYEETVAFIGRCYERAALLEALLGASLEQLDAAWVGLISGDQLLIQRGAGRWATLGERLVPLSAQTLRSLCASAPSWHVANTRALRALSPLATSRKELVLVPINIAGRSVVALGGVPRAGIMGLDALDKVVALSALVSAQLESIILLSKSGKLPPPEERVPPAPRPPKARPKPPPIPTLRKLAKPPAIPAQLVAQEPEAADIPQIKSKEELPPHQSVSRTMLGGFDFYRPSQPLQRELQESSAVSRADDAAAPPEDVNRTLLGGFEPYRPARPAAKEAPSRPIVGQTQLSGAAYVPKPPSETPGSMILKGARRKRRANHGEARRTLQNGPVYKTSAEQNLSEPSSAC